ncbi:unnamed protein product, partial [Scytosiphon promiscuus]
QLEPSNTQREVFVTGSNLRIRSNGGNRDRNRTGQDLQRSLSGDADGATLQMAGGRESDSDRDYLQGLVEATALAKHDQVANIAFLKTHKTASTTLAAILYRYSARHDLKLARFKNLQVNGLQSAAIQTQETGELVDIMHYHISLNGQYRGTWKEAAGYYRDIMRYPNRINFVTLLREPRSHLLSYYYYYIQPKNQLSIEEFLMNPTDPNDRDH